MSKFLPLLKRNDKVPIAYFKNKKISLAVFLNDVQKTARALPKKTYVINLCSEYYHFIIGFSAALSLGQITVLPPGRAPKLVKEIMLQYDSIYIIDDSHIVHSVDVEVKASIPLIPKNHIASIMYTSGSTGMPQPHFKSWQQLVFGAEINKQALPYPESQTLSLVATVPAQHMYGLEYSVMQVLYGNIQVWSGAAFYPDDIRQALNKLNSPRILISSPIHLDMCMRENIKWPEINFIVSATAPLSYEQAERLGAYFSCLVFEIYGSTETGSIASRYPKKKEVWKLHNGIRLEQEEENDVLQSYAVSKHFLERIALSDHIKCLDYEHFELHGRHSDMIKIAGKRGSLAELNLRLLNINGVIDSVYISPKLINIDNELQRPIALVVTDGTITIKTIQKKLADYIDDLFIPREIYIVDKLPRNQTSKLQRDELLKMILHLRKDG